MRREDLGDLSAFMAVAEERSFTRAAARLGTSQSALSHAMRRLEARLGVRLLTRTTRSVMPTEAGERLIGALRPALDGIETQLAELTAFREKPGGTIRITTSRHAAEKVLWPVVTRLVADYPDIKVELAVDHALVNIVEERFDAGVRLGERLAKDMIALRIGPDLRMVVVGAPAYLERHGAPKTPHDLTAHRCINLRMPTSGALYAWEFERDGRELNVRVEGQLILNSTDLIVEAACEGLGLACVLEDVAAQHVAAGRLVEVLADWSPPFAGYHLYYPSRRQPTPAFSLFLDALRAHARTLA